MKSWKHICRNYNATLGTSAPRCRPAMATSSTCAMSEGLKICEGARVVMWWALSAHLVEMRLNDLSKSGGGGACAPVPPPPPPVSTALLCNVHASLGVIPGLV